MGFIPIVSVLPMLTPLVMSTALVFATTVFHQLLKHPALFAREQRMHGQSTVNAYGADLAPDWVHLRVLGQDGVPVGSVLLPEPSQLLSFGTQLLFQRLNHLFLLLTSILKLTLLLRIESETLGKSFHLALAPLLTALLSEHGRG